MNEQLATTWVDEKIPPLEPDTSVWPTPTQLPNDLPPVQPFSFACLPDTCRPWIEDISERMQCIESHARRIYSAILRPEAAAARELAKHLKRGDLGNKFTIRETYRKGWTGLSSKEDAESAVEILCELNWIRLVQSNGS